MAEILAIYKKEDVEKIKEFLSSQRHRVHVVSGWAEALDALEENEYALYLVQHLPALGPVAEMSGRLSELREKQNLPAIAMVAEKELKAGVMLWGFNDFLLEPFLHEELICRIARLLRSPAGEGKNTLAVGDLVIDFEKYQVFLSGRPVSLTYKEFQLLKHLVTNRGRVFSREALLNQVWGYDYFGGDRTVDVHVRRLRSKIEDSTHSFVETVRNVGYRFIGQNNSDLRNRDD